MDQIEEVKQKTDIVEVVGEHVQLKRAGRNFKGLCPFHGEKTPSFMVNPELQIYKCFGCGVGGDVYEFLQRMEGMTFSEALQHLAKQVGVKLVSWRPQGWEEDRERLVKMNDLGAQAYHWLLLEHKTGVKALTYIRGRGLDEETIKKFRLGYAPGGWDFLAKFLGTKKGYDRKDLERAGLVVEGKGYDRFRDRIMFPLNNNRGQTVGFAGRVMPGADEGAGGKYVNTPETELYHKGELLYGFDVTRGEIKRLGWVVVVEGEIDAMASWQAGVKNVVAIKGSALTERQVELLRRVAETAVLALDADVAGDTAARRGIEMAEKAGLTVKIAKLGGAKDPGEMAIADPQGWKKAVAEAIPIYDFYLESAVSRYGLEVAGKKKIGQELLPIWANIPDEIVKGHYIGRLAKVLEVREEDIRNQLTKVSKSEFLISKQLPNDQTGDQKNSEREMREGRVVLLAILGGRTEELAEGRVGKLITSTFWRQVVDALGKDPQIKTLPAELKEKVGELLMTEEEFSEKKWEEAVNLLKLTDVGERLKQTEDAVEVDKLAREKAELTKGR